MTEVPGRASATALEVLNQALEEAKLGEARALVEQIYGIEERLQFDKDRHEAPSRVRDAVTVYLAKAEGLGDAK